MAKSVKCPMCNKLNNKEDTEQIDGRYYCIECAKKRKEQKERNKNDWDELFEYICDLYDIDKPTGFMFKQIKEFRDVYGYTNKGILLTLKYYYETLENELIEDVGLGIVIYYYEQAKQYYIEKRDIERATKDFIPNEEARTVKVKLYQDINQYEQIKQLPFSNTSWDEGDMND